MSVHFSSDSSEWSTPQSFFDDLNAIHNFTLDPCCTKENCKCPLGFTKEEDGLTKDWSGHRAFMNPPYGRSIGRWMQKAYEESRKGALVVCLVPARTDTAWWHDWATKGKIEFIKGRLKFNDHKNPAPFPSAVVTFWPKEDPIKRLLDGRHEIRLEWAEPWPACGPDGNKLDAHIVLSATVHDCINMERNIWKQKGLPITDDSELLYEFMIVHWAAEVKK